MFLSLATLARSVCKQDCGYICGTSFHGVPGCAETLNFLREYGGSYFRRGLCSVRRGFAPSEGTCRKY